MDLSLLICRSLTKWPQTASIIPKEIMHDSADYEKVLLISESYFREEMDHSCLYSLFAEWPC